MFKEDLLEALQEFLKASKAKIVSAPEMSY